jgi:hypothetical protein
MKLKPLTPHDLQIELDMLNGNISRICVSHDITEIITSLGFAVDRLNMIAYTRINKLQEEAQKND